MLFNSLVAAAALAGVATCAPTKLEDRQAPSGVPDYVLKYGMLYFLFPSVSINIVGLQEYCSRLHMFPLLWHYNATNN